MFWGDKWALIEKKILGTQSFIFLRVVIKDYLIMTQLLLAIQIITNDFGCGLGRKISTPGLYIGKREVKECL